MKEQIAKARSLRCQMNWAEKVLWKKLRDRKVSAFKFRRQYPCGPYFLDFYCPELKLAIELDGDTHGNPEQQMRDRRRDAYLEKHSVRVLRFWNREIRENLDGVMMVIREEVGKLPLTPTLSPQTGRGRKTDPHPLPSLKGEERGEG